LDSGFFLTFEFVKKVVIVIFYFFSNEFGSLLFIGILLLIELYRIRWKGLELLEKEENIAIIEASIGR